MRQDLKHAIYGTPINEWIQGVPGELNRDAVGLWQIVPAGRDGFGLRDAALIEFLRQCIDALLSAGAVPVRGAPGSGYFWIWQKQYGSSHEEIANAVISEWQLVPDDPLLLVGECPWFARPNPDNPKYVKMD